MNSTLAEARRRLLETIPRIGTWHADGVRAPHKPLLLLLALGRLQRNEPRLVPFSEVEGKLRNLLKTHGPPRSSYHPEYPFWWLQTDGLWEVPGGEGLVKRKGHADPKIRELRRAQGGFTKEIHQVLEAEPDMVRQFGRTLLNEHFPASYHEDLLSAVGLEVAETAPRRTARDPGFREQVLNAYGYRCAICGLDPLIDGASAALEAAHLHWHSHGGPPRVENGLCLCPLHHKGLDLGAIGISEQRRVMISSRLHGGEALETFFGQYHGQALRGPVHGHPPVHLEFVRWHTQQVFKGPPRA